MAKRPEVFASLKGQIIRSATFQNGSDEFAEGMESLTLVLSDSRTIRLIPHRAPLGDGARLSIEVCGFEVE
jgi:hypothetical protein